MRKTTYQRRLKSGLEHVVQAAAKFYSEHEAPEQYSEDLAGVEVPPKPTAPPVTAELVLSVYRELRSVRKTADQLGLNREKVRRIVSAAV